MQSSEELLKQNLKIFKLKHFVNNKQKEAVKAIVKRKQDAIISMGPGNRKSLCFQLPGIMHENKITIVCSASNSSIKNQIHYLKKSKIGAISITSQLSDEERERLNEDVTSAEPKTRFIYVKPDVVSSEFFTDILHTLSTNDKLAYFAVDDAHLASPLQQDFCQDYLKFGSLRPAYPSVPWITLTHSASTDVRKDIVKNLQLREPVAEFIKSTFRKNIHHDIIFKNTILMIDLFTHLKNFLTSRLNSGDGDAKKPAGIIFCKNRETVDMVASKLTEIGFPTKAYHGGMTTSEKKKAQDEWLSGALPVITATTSFGGGVEKYGVRVVVHFDVPQSIAGFYKESGMAGRDGKLSYSRIYYCNSDVAEVDSTLRDAIDKSKNENAKRKALRAHADFLKMSDLCETVECRHKIFSKYFDDADPDCKAKCDVCTDQQEAEVALGLFHQFSTKTFPPIIIKSEPHHPANGQLSDPIRPARAVSPANTIIKEESTATVNQTNYSNQSDELFAMKTQPPRNVSPARTIIKEEPVTRIKQEVDSVTNSSALGGDRTETVRCVSPAETLIDEKPFRSSNHTTVLSDELFAMKAQPPRNVSPARTIVKEEANGEPNETESRADNSSQVFGEDNKAGIRLLSPTRCVSPAETIVDEKPLVRNGETAALGLVSPISNASNATMPGETTPEYSSAVIIKSEPKSPERQIDEKDKVEPPVDMNSVITVIKQEPTETQSTKNGAIFRRQSRSPSPTGTVVKEECLSPARVADFDTDEIPKNTTDRGQDSGESAPKISNRNADPDSATEKLQIKLEVATNQPVEHLETQSTENRANSHRQSRSPSPTGTVVKEECLSPARIADFDAEDISENTTDRGQDNVESAPKISNGELNRNADQNSGTGTLQTKLEVTKNQPVRNLEIIKDPSCEPEFVSSEILDRSTSSQQPNQPEDNRVRRSRSRSAERFKRENNRRERSRSNDRVKREKNARRRSRSTSLSSQRSRSQSVPRRRSRSRSRERYNRRDERSRRRSRSRSRSRSKERFKRERNATRRSRSSSVSRRRSRSRSVSRRRSRSPSGVSRRRSRSPSISRRRSRSRERLKRDKEKRHRRSRSNERLKRERSVDRKPSLSLNDKRASFKSERSRKRRRYSSDSGASTIVDQDYSSPKPSTSTKTNQSRSESQWTDRRFSASPETTNRQTDCEGDENDYDIEKYGREDPPPPKMKIEKPSNPMNDIIQQKVKEFGNKVSSSFDLEVIQAEQQELFRAIQETIDLTTKKKLTDLDEEIQRRKNDHIAKLFGTNNFDSWDGDPALSNVNNVKKLQSYKTFVPGDLPLYDKMTMKYEINAMRLKPTRIGNELVFQGNIKEIEKEFQGQELPHPLMEAIKEEKGVICDLVRKYLMPYYNAKRIQSNKVFTIVARKISHHFYGHSADENSIRQHVDDMFAKYGTITESTNLALIN